MGFVLLEDDSPTLFGAHGLSAAASPLHAEVEGLLWAIQEVLKQGNREVRFEFDCEQLITLMKEEEEWPAIAPELDGIKALSAEFIDVSITYIPRWLLLKGEDHVFRSSSVNCFAPS